VTRWLAAAIACGVLGLAAPPAHADRADQLFKKGKRLLAEKRYAEACSAFEDSDRLDPGIGAKLNVARCFQEWGKLATAWQWFTDAEQMARTTKDERAKKIHALIEELDPSVPRLTIKLPPAASAAALTLTLDGTVLPASALGVERRVDPGPHQIDYVIDGTKQTKIVPVERGGSSEVTLELPAAAEDGRPPSPRAATATVTADDDPGRGHRIAGLGIAGAGVVAVGIAGLVTYQARGDYRDALDAHCRGAKDMCDAVGLTATHDARHRANIATVVTVIGAVAVAGGLVLYLKAPRARRSSEHALYLAPTLGGRAGGVVLGGAF
jgi:tetratricopeptide (TPR) repeat protein